MTMVDFACKVEDSSWLREMMDQAELDVLAEGAQQAHEAWLNAARKLAETKARYASVQKPQTEADMSKDIRELLTTQDTTPSSLPGSRKIRALIVECAIQTAAWQDAESALASAREAAEKCAKDAHDLFVRMVQALRKVPG